MGCWAVGSFGNDAAGDYAIDLRENPTYEFLRQTFEISKNNLQEPWVNEQAVAAAEVICIIDGTIPDDYKEVEHNLAPAIAILKQQKFPADLKNLALQTLKLIERKSNLEDCWEGDEEWLAEMKALKERLCS